MQSNGASIRIFLADGTADGLRLIEKSNWTGLGIVCPRSSYGSARQRDEFARPGVYVLVGPGDSLSQVYIGEAEELRSRLDAHQQHKDFWTRIVAFISKDGNLNKAHVRYLESRLIGLAHAAKRAEVANGNVPTLPALSEPDAADMENFLQEMLLIYPLLEVTAFQLASASTGSGASAGATQPFVAAPLQLVGPFTSAAGADTSNGFLVTGGSRGRTLETATMQPWMRNIRKGLIEQGILQPDGEQLLLTQDYVFDSPSSAAGVLLGRSVNGRTEWKNAHGESLKKLQTQALIK